MICASTTTCRIYDKIYSWCPAYTLPGPWSYLPADPDVRACLPDPNSALQQLSDRFSWSALLKAGVARETASAGFEIAAGLASGEPLVFLRHEPRQKPVGVLTPTGSLWGPLPIIASLSDYHTRLALKTWQQHLFVA